VATRRPRAAGLAGLALLGTLLVPLVTPAPAAADQTATAHQPVPPARWEACTLPPGTPPMPVPGDCARVTVPVDWSRPGGASLQLLLGRLPARRPDQRIGSLVFNPGGPGGAGALFVASGRFPFPDLLRDRFDIVGFDPRGVGDSSPVDCGGRPGLHPDIPAFPRTRADFDRLVRYSRQTGALCARRTGDLIKHVDTVSAARDLDVVRAALGERRLTWLGLSYGSLLGATYASLYPHRAGAMVFDGGMDHSVGPRRMLLDEAAEMERTFSAFADWCEATPTCALYGHDVRAVWDRLVATADRRPIPVRGTTRALDGGAIRMALPFTLIHHGDLIDEWPGLATAIAQAALAGDATLLSRVTAVGQYNPGAAIACHDFAPQLRGYRDFRSRLAAARRVAPRTGGATEGWLATAGCAGWPVRPANPWGPVRVSGTPPILIVSSTLDASTPLRWAYGMRRQVQGSGLLLVRTVGHTGYLQSACARETEARYLVSGKLPPTGTVCR
jgi:pimeloyl-ACP methyl ester carboxylesterase